jgi:hypothetical protein
MSLVGEADKQIDVPAHRRVGFGAVRHKRGPFPCPPGGSARQRSVDSMDSRSAAYALYRVEAPANRHPGFLTIRRIGRITGDEHAIQVSSQAHCPTGCEVRAPPPQHIAMPVSPRGVIVVANFAPLKPHGRIHSLVVNRSRSPSWKRPAVPPARYAAVTPEGGVDGMASRHLAEKADHHPDCVPSTEPRCPVSWEDAKGRGCDIPVLATRGSGG